MSQPLVRRSRHDKLELKSADEEVQDLTAHGLQEHRLARSCEGQRQREGRPVGAVKQHLRSRARENKEYLEDRYTMVVGIPGKATECSQGISLSSQEPTAGKESAAARALGVPVALCARKIFPTIAAGLKDLHLAQRR